MSSDHLAGGLPTALRPSLGHHSVTAFVHLPSSRRAKCPAHSHFSSATSIPTSNTLVLLRITTLGIRSLSEMPNMARSIALCATLIRCTVSLVSVHVSAPYVSVGKTHWLNTLVFRHCGILDFRTSSSFEKAAHPS
ncbi:hypothetical protein JYU34_004659 [Plutella xylostella]|uniref:Uncharacterized protein n=1 Tax=Plutella xylostella TaxID=51655 RepID=A0ABQ7QYJ2_PLUXY|nr:hypothetical protein JYU34_004659 [Plutella xylostella]